MQGAFIATFGIVLSKILGMIYVIPFYSIIGDQGGALYGYAYSIYSMVFQWQSVRLLVNTTFLAIIMQKLEHLSWGERH